MNSTQLDGWAHIDQNLVVVDYVKIHQKSYLLPRHIIKNPKSEKTKIETKKFMCERGKNATLAIIRLRRLSQKYNGYVCQSQRQILLIN